jgi:ATP-binding cassette subfamily B protein
VDPSRPVAVPDRLHQGVVVDGVDFTYPGCEQEVLHEIDMRIEPGQVVALVGANGSGKTSLIKLLTRLYDPSRGRIMVDGHDIREFDLEAYRRLFSVIFQDFARYADTARQNIRFGDIQAQPHDPGVQRAAGLAGADAFIRALPSGYDTVLSRMFQGGQEISVGQWQKIALARAFMSGSRVIILDEPTSALDPNSEFELFENFKERIGDRAALVISHRLSTIRMADYIYVLNEGKIVEQGRHDQLMALEGIYHEAFSKQGKYYRHGQPASIGMGS